ncbi:MAG: lipoyl(octanoyl) transferase [Urechidicola sp.]|jgi:lipoyl(octanoyl) transferase
MARKTPKYGKSLLESSNSSTKLFKFLMSKYAVNNLGTQAYEETWKLQQEYFSDALAAKKEGRSVESKVLYVEHPPVFTLGKSADKNNILLSEDILGAPVFRIERGGDVTFHGPGQLLIYPIIDLEQFNMNLREYVYNMEEVIIRSIAEFGLEGSRSDGASGVWLDVGTPQERKIAALGVKASRHITMHGLAFNINTDLSWFQKINPCGFLDKGVTNLAIELNEKQDYKAVCAIVKREFELIFK